MNHADSFFLREKKREMSRQVNRAALEASRDPNSEFLFVTALCLGAVLAGALAIQSMGR